MNRTLRSIGVTLDSHQPTLYVREGEFAATLATRGLMSRWWLYCHQSTVQHMTLNLNSLMISWGESRDYKRDTFADVATSSAVAEILSEFVDELPLVWQKWIARFTSADSPYMRTLGMGIGLHTDSRTSTVLTDVTVTHGVAFDALVAEGKVVPSNGRFLASIDRGMLVYTDADGFSDWHHASDVTSAAIAPFMEGVPVTLSDAWTRWIPVARPELGGGI